ncbi:uncharacterized protein LOC129611113 [Condylostylus longicornis]|uniref:uncharacterized protein LOC129611113 n=1 Tax=Condylostylus longicornis TaxID=2530218 RepID=UPI00244DDC0F|nr:uncharacterized protein LOC129611113 [Condylostylus longicornis]
MAKTNSLYVVGLTCLGFICFALASAAVGIPIWGHFQSVGGGYMEETGYFGPWRVCKFLSYFREKCGTDISKFRPSVAVFASGVLASLCAVALAIYSLLSVIQIAMVASQETIVMKYKNLVLLKMILGLTACILAIISAALFAVQMDESNKNGYIITRGVSFYLQIVVVILTICLFGLTLYDVLSSRKSGGDPTMLISSDPGNSASAITINNPGFREGRRKTSFKGVSVTDASGRPYDDIKNGSVISVDTTLTSVSNSTLESVTRSPLRSSLKKPRPPGELGIRNPGFANHEGSPSMRRNGSMKKVRINVHSTDV